MSSVSLVARGPLFAPAAWWWARTEEAVEDGVDEKSVVFSRSADGYHGGPEGVLQ